MPSAAEMAEFGFTEEDYAGDPIDVLPDNEVAFDLFRYLRTQWRVGMAGPTGLDYGPMLHKMDRMKLSPDDYDSLEQDMQVMEVAALNKMNEKI